MVQREAWKEVTIAAQRGWAYAKDRAVTAALVLYGWLLSTAVYAAISGAFTSQIAAQSPIHVTEVGVDKILWAVVTFMALTLIAIAKWWVNKQDKITAVHSRSIARIESKLNRLLGLDEGEDRAARRFRDEFGDDKDRR